MKLFKNLISTVALLAFASNAFAADITLRTIGTGAAVSSNDIFISRQGADTVDKSVTAAQLKAYTTVTGNQLSIDASGTVYALTATAAAVDFGTTDPALTITAAGTYFVTWQACSKYTGATFASNRTVTLKLRRTNNTAGDVSTGTQTTDVTTTKTETLGCVSRSLIYTTANADDALSVFGDVSVLPSAGTLDITSASIYAFRLQL